MPNFDYRRSTETLFNRFQGFDGAGLWHILLESRNYENFDRLRTFGLNLQSQPRRLKCPRIFISHRKFDTNHAVRIANIATECSCEYWLDIFDPDLQSMNLQSMSKDEHDILIAGIIEIAIMNCTHVMAVMTPNSQGSFWIPYEYGRITELPTQRGRAAAWLDPELTYIPEYLLLGVKAENDHEIRRWFKSESAAWP